MVVNNKYELLLDSLKNIEEQTSKLFGINISNSDMPSLEILLRENESLKKQIEEYKKQLINANKVLKDTIIKLKELEKNY